MPKLPEQYINAEAEDGTKYRAKVIPYVDSSGEFSIEVPEDLKGVVEKVNREGYHVHFKTVRHRYCICAKSMDPLIVILKRAAKASITVDTVVDRVILYRIDLLVRFWLDSKKRIHPHGGDGQDGGWWRPKVAASYSHSFNKPELHNAVAVCAVVFDRTTHKRPTGDTVTWEYYRGNEDPDAAYLNSLSGGGIDPESGNQAPHKLMPYTPAAAKFFSSVIMGLCQMALNIDEFFSDEEKLNSTIAKGGNLLGFTKGK